MSLSREARGLVDAARREAAGPSQEQRKRMRRAVMAAVGTGAIAGATATSGTAAAAIATSSGLGLISKVGIGLAVVGLIGGGAALVSQRDDAPAAAASVPVAQPASTGVSVAAVASVTVTSPPTTTSAEAEPVTSERVAVQSASASAAAQAPSQRALPETNGLAEELRLLKEAQAASGAAAVAILDQYAARFPKGQLAYEARALRAMALCRSGRVDEGRAIATAISQSSPGTPLAENVNAACK